MTIKALLVGINAYPRIPLRGCLNDIANTNAILQQRVGGTGAMIRVLRDADATRSAIEAGLEWLAQPDAAAAVRLFHFSGHGTYVLDQDGDEPDGRDEAIVPYDYERAGAMTDDVLRQRADAFGRDVHLVVIMDCCHSGTITRVLEEDIIYRFLPNSFEEERQFDAAAQRVRERRDRYVMEQVRDLRGRAVDDEEWERRVREAMAHFDKRHFGLDKLRGNVVLLSACRADQTAADARIGNDYHGAFTYYLNEVVSQAGSAITYYALIEQVGQRLYHNKFAQVPQLECSLRHRQSVFLGAGA
ncbi:caspase family protein [Kallotenue papyrolyticum]|uniref:caspase family protein n=1 Tax=Kallotenue papyrolyticum TaxID=1325125 RepID=UPI0004722C96|nr:caspase family protein [Kallotenue papyrolyticum]